MDVTGTGAATLFQTTVRYGNGIIYGTGYRYGQTTSGVIAYASGGIVVLGIAAATLMQVTAVGTGIKGVSGILAAMLQKTRASGCGNTPLAPNAPNYEAINAKLLEENPNLKRLTDQFPLDRHKAWMLLRKHRTDIVLGNKKKAA